MNKKENIVNQVGWVKLHFRRHLIQGLRIFERLSLKGQTQAAQSWLIFWLLGLAVVWLWNLLFLNRPAFVLLNQAFIDSMFIATLVVVFTFLFAWGWLMLLHYLQENQFVHGLTLVHFVLNLIRSIPQIVGVLFGYIMLTRWIEKGSLQNALPMMVVMSLFISLFLFLEVFDLLQERLRYFQSSDFYNAMRVCGISTWRIVNYDILWKNSLTHLLNKAIGVFASAIFLQCSVDFIVSVGLTTRISAVNLPVTLGSLLASIDSKQDILAIGYTLGHPAYFPHLLFRHLQGLSVAFMIVFTLLCLFKITTAMAERLEN